MRIEDSIDITAPVARVWELTLDVESWPQHTPTMTSIERLDTGPLGVGSQARVKQPGQRAKVWTVTALEPERKFAWSTKSMRMTMTGTHALGARETGTTNKLTVEIEGPLSSLIGALLRRPIAKAIAQENRGFKTAAER
jgi:uncharacterized membrane protein